MGTAGTREFWDGQAAGFDEEPDHGLRSAPVRQAWEELLLPLLDAPGRPPAGRDVVDLGCGTGSLSVLLAGHGHRVTGIDLSDAMVAAAAAKARAGGIDAVFRQGDVSRPDLPAASTDVVLSRHVLWAMPDPADALSRWVRLLRPGGRLVLVEGRWWTGTGLSADEAERLVEGVGLLPRVRRLTDPALWGRETQDERYLLVADTPTGRPRPTG